MQICVFSFKTTLFGTQNHEKSTRRTLVEPLGRSWFGGFNQGEIFQKPGWLMIIVMGIINQGNQGFFLIEFIEQCIIQYKSNCKAWLVDDYRGLH
jgi:hypothetical protein